MKIRIKLISYIVILLVCYVSSLSVFGDQANPNHGKTQSYPLTPEGVVEAYCLESFNGAGLSSDTWVKIQKYTVWEDGPGWDTAVVVSNYKITKIRESSNTAEIKVEYEIIADLPADIRGFKLTTDRLSVAFLYKLIKQEGHWKIKSPQEPPHISISATIDKLNNYISVKRDARTINNIRSIIYYLNNKK
ncbi:hypothetical protein [Geotalea uraniireducens]|uniref:hypothetical protein n=1 Tax=Geotalea uraniireducens TaxID=351604 RepID=UPI00059D1A54|nr:hypothetical protein [Geotalea uraniireducens]